MSRYKLISSRQNPVVKDIFALLDKKNRRQTHLFRFDGRKLLLEAVDCGVALSYIVIREDARERFASECENAISKGLVARDGVLCVTEAVFEKLCDEKSPEGVICVAKFCEDLHIERTACDTAASIDKDERILIAESLRDPGNLGTVIRTCAALGIDRLIISDDCADLYSPRTVRAAMGALFRQRIEIIHADELAETIGLLRNSGRNIYAAALHTDALTVGSFELKRGDAFVIGNEGHGLSERVIAACTDCAAIPMTEGAESLNAAVAAAICVWETARA